MNRYLVASLCALAIAAVAPATASAYSGSVAAYQRSHGLVVDGVVGHQTASMMLSGRRAAPGPLRTYERRALGLASYTPRYRSYRSYGSSTRSYRTRSYSSSSSSSGGGWSIPSRVVQCESGGQNLAPNGSSASGYYQITDSTWRENGGSTAHASSASKAEQDRVAARIWSQAGSSQWVCK